MLATGKWVPELIERILEQDHAEGGRGARSGGEHRALGPSTATACPAEL